MESRYKVLIVNGPPGSGKSLVGRLLARVAEDTPTLEVVSVDMVGPNRRAGDVAVILARSLHAPVTEGELATREDVPVSALAQALMVRSQDLDGRVVWVLDGVSSPAVDPRALELVQELAVLVSRQPGDKLALVLLDFRDAPKGLDATAVRWEKLGPVEAEDVRSFVRLKADESGLAVSAREVDLAARRAVGGPPQRTRPQCALVEAARGVGDAGRSRRAAAG